jgi:hypothetical protein
MLSAYSTSHALSLSLDLLGILIINVHDFIVGSVGRPCGAGVFAVFVLGDGLAARSLSSTYPELRLLLLGKVSERQVVSRVSARSIAMLSRKSLS